MEATTVSLQNIPQKEESKNSSDFSIYQLRKDVNETSITDQLYSCLHHAKSQAAIMSVSTEAFELWNANIVSEYGYGMMSLLEEAIFLLDQLYPIICKSKVTREGVGD